jgi:hypothetical protein
MRRVAAWNQAVWTFLEFEGAYYPLWWLLLLIGGHHTPKKLNVEEMWLTKNLAATTVH